MELTLCHEWHSRLIAEYILQGILDGTGDNYFDDCEGRHEDKLGNEMLLKKLAPRHGQFWHTRLASNQSLYIPMPRQLLRLPGSA